MDQSGCRTGSIYVGATLAELLGPALRRVSRMAQATEVFCSGVPDAPVFACPGCVDSHAAAPEAVNDH